MKIIYLCLLFGLLCNHKCKKTERYNPALTSNYQNTENFDWKSLVRSSSAIDSMKTPLKALFDTAYAWKYDSANLEDRIYLYDFYSDFVAGGGGFSSPSSNETMSTFIGKDKNSVGFVFLLPFMSRDARIVEKLYESHQDDFYKILTKEYAYQLNIDVMADDLLFTYDTLFSKNTPKQIFIKYKSGAQMSDDIMVSILGPCKINEKWRYKPLNGYKQWIYTFWYRRYLEGNIPICLKIIKDIHQKYPPRANKYIWRDNWYKGMAKIKANEPEVYEVIKNILKDAGLFKKKVAPIRYETKK